MILCSTGETQRQLIRKFGQLVEKYPNWLELDATEKEVLR